MREISNEVKLKYLCSAFSTTLSLGEINKETGEYAVYGAAGLMGYIDDYRSDEEYLGIVKDGAGVGRISKYPARTSLLGTMTAIIPNKNVNIDWLKFAIISMDLGNSIDKTTIPHIYFSVYGNNKIRDIDFFEQEKISTFLNRKTSQIDTLIANQEAQIEKLKQYKQSLITEVVTKGLTPDVEMKDSGVEWIGKIPRHWDIIRGKAVLENLSRKVESEMEVITCFRDGEVTLRRNRREEGFTFSDKEIGYQGIYPGDLVVHGMDGFAGAIGISDSKGKGSPILIVCDSKENKNYLMYYLRNLAYRDIFLALSTGIRVRSCDLRWNKLSVLPFVIPPKKEQDEIIDYLNNKCTRINKLIEIKQSKIAKLNEYKKSLIYEYVTGKKEVY